MTDLEVFGLLIIAMALCFANWRIGVFICIVIGFLQDPLRKLIPGEPIYFTAMVGAPLAMTLVGARLRNVRLSFRPMHSWNDVLRTPLRCFVALVLVQSAAAFIKTGSPAVAGIGALSYLAPLPAILLGYQFSRNEQTVVKVTKVYLLVGVPMVLGVYLSYAGFDWTILKQVGTGLFIYSQERGRLDLYSGFLRSPEIAAWHAATAACLLMLVALAIRRNLILKWGAGVLVPALLGVILLTGRRKFLVEIFLFISVYALMLIWFQRTAIKSPLISKSALLVAGGVVLASVAYIYIAPDETATEIRPYYERGMSVRNDVTERVSVMTIASFQYVIAQNGVLGSGAGTGSQGVQHFGGQTTGASAEGGLAKVLAELGVPGLLVLLWVALSFARYLWSIVQYVSKLPEADPVLAKLMFGLVALLMTNGVVYVIAHQVFGDPFVLIILGILLGFVMATPKLLMRSADDRRRATADRRVAAADRAENDDRRRATEDRRQREDRRPMTGPSSAVVGRRSPVIGQ